MSYKKLNLNKKEKLKIVTVHGRFQPPLHINHYHTYLKNAFKISEKVKILITNPFLNAKSTSKAIHRSNPKNNPFTYEDRIYIFTKFFNNMGIPKNRYEFYPFDITNEKTWKNNLDKAIPNYINTYGAWSKAKLKKFLENDYQVIHSNNPEIKDISGTKIREILNQDIDNKKDKLISAGLMPEAVDAVLKIYETKIISSTK